MAVTEQTPLNAYTGNGSSVLFPFNFKVLASGDLVVTVDGVVQTLGVHYSASGFGAANGGTVTFFSAPASLASVVLYRDTTLERTTDYQTNGDFLASSFNADLDRPILILQEIFGGGKGVVNALRVPNGESLSVLPPAAARALRIPAFGADGDAILLVGVDAASATALQLDLADSATTSKGDALIGVKRLSIGAVGLTLHNWIQAATINVKEFGAVGDGVADDTVAIQNAINAAADRSLIALPAGTFKTTAKLILGQRKHLRGAGRWSTRILFEPSANETCIEIKNASTVVDQGSLMDLCIYSNDSAFTKIAIDVVDCNSYSIANVTIGGSVVVSGSSYWSGANSIGLRTRGRQALSVSNIDIAADRPLVIATNPNNPIAVDHFNFHNLYLIANASPCVEVLSGVDLTQCSFTGYQAWVRGTSGFKWADTTSTLASNGLLLENIRWEQGTDSAAYSIDISHNVALQGLTVRRCYGGVDRRGVKLRKVEDVHFDGHYHAGATEALNVDATVKRLTMSATFWQAGATASMTGQRLVRGAPRNPNSAPLPPDAYYDEAANAARTEVHDGVIGSTAITLANNATAEIAGTATTALIAVVGKNDSCALFFLNGAAHTVNEISDPASTFSGAAGTASSTNIYWSGANSRYEIENKRGATLTYVVVPIGAYS